MILGYMCMLDSAPYHLSSPQKQICVSLKEEAIWGMDLVHVRGVSHYNNLPHVVQVPLQSLFVFESVFSYLYSNRFYLFCCVRAL